jgi:hypothetical protein
MRADPGSTYFFLGGPPHWLRTAGVPLFVCDTALRDRKTYPRAIWPYAVDSGGFNALKKHGRWTVSEQEYADRIQRYDAEIGRAVFYAPQDWMCEPIIINGGTIRGQVYVGTHLTVLEHQHRTVANLCRLRELAPGLPIMPVLQGYTLDEYIRIIEIYSRAGVDLAAEPVVGLGSVCRRQATSEIAAIAATIAGAGLKLHGFGVKTDGLADYGEHLQSADSYAWSKAGMHVKGCSPSHKSESTCLDFALAWRHRVLDRAAGPSQLTLPLALASVDARLRTPNR